MLWFQKNGLTLNESVLVSAAQRGDIELFERIWNDIWNDDSLDCNGLEQLIYDAFEGAAQFGHLNLLKFADSKSMLPSLHQIGTSVFFQAASKNGHLKILEWLFQEKQTTNTSRHYEKAFSAAVSGNKMDVLVWLKSFLDQGLWEAFVTSSVQPYVSIAARHGNKNLVMWLIDQGFYSDQNSASAAATAGSIDLLKFFRYLWSEHVYTKAAEKGHLSVLKWAREDAEHNYIWPETKMFPAVLNLARENAEQNYPWPEAKMFPAAAKCDNVELYQWLFDQNFPFEEEKSFIIALKLGHFKFIKFARSHGSLFWNDALYYSLLERAAQVGDLEIVQWAMIEQQNEVVTSNATRQAIDFTLVAIEAAATGGHLHILEYLKLNITEAVLERVVEVAAENGHVAIFDWASAMGFFQNAEKMIMYKIFLSAVNGSQLKVLVWMKNQFPDIVRWFNHPLVVAATIGDIEVFKWLRNSGMKWHPMIWKVAEECNHLDIAKWTIQNGCPSDGVCPGYYGKPKKKGLDLSEYKEEQEDKEDDLEQDD
jgi:ankyrin repeat protein